MANLELIKFSLKIFCIAATVLEKQCKIELKSSLIGLTILSVFLSKPWELEVVPRTSLVANLQLINLDLKNLFFAVTAFEKI